MRKYYQRRLPEDPTQDYYYIIRETNPLQSLLVEYGFIDNANDRVKLQNDLLNYVEAVVRAIANYAGVTYIPPEGSTDIYYTVKKGDSLWSIATQYGISVNELKNANNLTSNTLQIGQVLKIPTLTGNDNIGTGGSTYTVKSGDSLWSIANQYGITVDELKRANNLTSNTLQIGQVLTIPGQTTTPPTGNVTYTVKSGDSLWSIANQYGITVDELKRANNLTSNTLQIGQVLTIPGQTTTPPTGNVTYTVKRGDSLWSIASQYGVSVNALRTANNLTTDTLQIGQVLVIPGQGNTTPENITYTVKSGDSLWSIANTYNTTVDELKRLNNLTTNLLSIGQQLIIPTN